MPDPAPAASQQPAERQVRPPVLGAYFQGSRLRAMPRRGQRRQAVLEHLATWFEPGRHYPEAEVNAILRAADDDVAALRRYLVDAGLMDRACGVYWRCGGQVDV